jgi:hemerythrin-like domain-containing protein
MLPIAPLMIEHRLIERVMVLMENVSPQNPPDAEFTEDLADFFVTFVDGGHHGKEEDILFDALEACDMEDKQRRMLDELWAEHDEAREVVEGFDKARAELEGGEEEAEKLVDALNDLRDLYARHIEKEDERFFLPVMEYFEDDEQDEMLERMKAYDEPSHREDYEELVDDLEARQLG